MEYSAEDSAPSSQGTVDHRTYWWRSGETSDGQQALRNTLSCFQLFMKDDKNAYWTALVYMAKAQIIILHRIVKLEIWWGTRSPVSFHTALSSYCEPPCLKSHDLYRQLKVFLLHGTVLWISVQDMMDVSNSLNTKCLLTWCARRFFTQKLKGSPLREVPNHLSIVMGYFMG